MIESFYCVQKYFKKLSKTHKKNSIETRNKRTKKI